MKRMKLNEKGIGHLLALLAVAVVLAVGFAGWRVLQRGQSADSAATSNAASQTVPVLETKADVSKAAGELDALSVENTLDPNTLDSDLNALL